jgi:TonB family protein
MNFFYTYLLQSSVSIMVLYFIYWLFLKKDTFFSVNRFFLTGSIIFSLLFPLFRWNINLSDSNAPYVYLLDTVTITPDKLEAVVSSQISLFKMIVIVYMTGASLFFIRFLFQVFQVFTLVKRSGISRQQGIKLVFIDRHYQPFSFFGIVFIPKSLGESKDLLQIIEHERVHVRQNHSFDLLLLELLTIIQWYNPIIWFYRRSIKSIHEYLADEGVIILGFSKINYQELLLGQSLGIQVNDLTNNFNHSLLKNRIMMMTKPRSGAFSGWKATLALPVMLGLVTIFSTSVNTGLAKEYPNAAQITVHSSMPMDVEIPAIITPGEDTIPKAAAKEPVYEVVKTMPEFNGGFDALVNYLVTNVKYPEEAKKNNITGTVFVSFIVEKNGKVSNPSILKSANPLLDDEALRVVAAMPNWKPGLNDEGVAVNVKFNLPIKFALDNKDVKEEKK